MTGALARLMADAEGEGGDRRTLAALAAEASEAGAQRALERLGLADAGARADIGELRELLEAWRDAKRSAWREVVQWGTRIALAILVMGLAVKLGLIGLIRP